MFLFTFQAEAFCLLIKVAKFPGVLPAFGNAFGQGGALTAVNPGAVEFGNGVPSNIAFGIKGPIDRKSVV